MDKQLRKEIFQSRQTRLIKAMDVLGGFHGMAEWLRRWKAEGGGTLAQIEALEEYLDDQVPLGPGWL